MKTYQSLRDAIFGQEIAVSSCIGRFASTIRCRRSSWYARANTQRSVYINSQDGKPLQLYRPMRVESKLTILCDNKLNILGKYRAVELLWTSAHSGVSQLWVLN